MLKRRAKIRVKPVLAGALANSSSTNLDETTELNVAPETAPETILPVNEIKQQEPEEEEQQPQQQPQQQLDTEDIKSILPSVEECRNGNELNLNDDALSTNSEQDPLDSYIKFDDTPDGLLSLSSFRLNDSALNETCQEKELNNSENADENCEPTTPNAFSNWHEKTLSSQMSSPAPSSVFSESFDASKTLSSQRSNTSSMFDRKRAAERLAERLVKKRVVERQATRSNRYLDEPVDSSQVLMKDMIYLNPRDNPMSSTSLTGRTILKEAVVPERPKTPEEEELPCPRLEIGPDGRIIVNEASLVIKQKEANFDDMMVVDDTNYVFDGYKSKKPRSKKWGMKETRRFYAGLSMVGLDFSFLSKFFPHRTRDEIKNKFKNEDKKNKALIDTALKMRKPLDISLLAEPPSDDDLEDDKPVKPKKKKTPATPKPKAPKENNKKRQEKSKDANKSQDSPKKKAATKSRRRVLVESSNGEGSSSESESSVPPSKRRKVIEDEDSTENENHNDNNNNNREAPAGKDPFEFTGEGENECSLEISQLAPRRKRGIIPETSRSPTESRTPTPVEELAPDSPTSLRLKLSQQLEQIEVDQQISAIKADLDVQEDNPQRPENDNDDEDDKVTEPRGNPADGSQKLFSRLRIGGKSDSSINVVDHRSVNLEELGISEIPPNHKLVVVSTPLEDRPAGAVSDSERQQLLQVFTISDSALEAMMEGVDDSAFDPVAALLAMAQEESFQVSELEGLQLSNFSFDPLESPLTCSDAEENILDGLISDEFQNLPSPPAVRNEPIAEETKIIPIVEGNHELCMNESTD